MSDPFLQSTDAEVLRGEIRKLQKENRELQSTVAQLKAKATMLSTVHSGESNKSNGAATAKGRKTEDASGVELARLKEENGKMKKELLTAQNECAAAVAEKAHSEQLLEAVGVAACEREQRLRVVAATIQGELEEAKSSLALERERWTAELSRVQREAPVVMMPPPQARQEQPQVVVQQRGPSLEEVRNTFQSLRRAMRQLESKYADGGSLGVEDDGEDANDTRTITSQHTRASAPARRSVPPVSEASLHHATAEEPPSSVRKRGRPPKLSSGLSAAGGDERVSTKGTRKETTAALSESAESAARGRHANQKIALQDNIAARAAAESAAASSRRRSAAAGGSLTSSSGVGGVAPASVKGSITFSENPFEDAYALISGIPLSRRQQSLETLSRGLYQHFHMDVVEMVKKLVAFIASAAPKWCCTKSSATEQQQNEEDPPVISNVREVERRVVAYAELLDLCGGDALLDSWGRTTIELLTVLISEADHVVAVDQSPQIAPLATTVRVVSEWRTSKAQRLAGGGGGAAPTTPSASMTTAALYWCVVAYCQTAHRHPERRLLDGPWTAASYRHPLVSLGLHLFCSGALTMPLLDQSADAEALADATLELADRAIATRPAHVTLLTLVLQAVFVELLARHEVPAAASSAICAAAGWSFCRMPIQDLKQMCIRAALDGGAGGSRSLDAVHGLRLLVAMDGLSFLDVITKQWGELSSTPSALMENALALLLSFVVIDFGVMNHRDEEWVRTATYLQDFLAEEQQPPTSQGKKKGAPTTTGTVEAAHAAVSLVFMAGEATVQDVDPGAASSVLEKCWTASAAWWMREKKRQQQQRDQKPSELECVSLFNRMDELFGTICTRSRSALALN